MRIIELKKMKYCAVIPCYNHADTLPKVLDGLPEGLDAIVYDDGSNPPVQKHPRALLIRGEKNLGKSEALKRLFKKADEMGFTHAVSLDADCQHDPRLLPEIVALSQKNPDALIAGVRDFSAEGIPEKRRFMNKFSNFWFRVETSQTLADTQCGYRCYPLGLVKRLKISFGAYAYEAEMLVKTIWAGGRILSVKIPTLYTEKSTASSHYRPFKDTFIISCMNTKLTFQSLLLPKSALKKLAVKK